MKKHQKCHHPLQLSGEQLEQRHCLAGIASLIPSTEAVFEGDSVDFTLTLDAAPAQPERIEILVAGNTASLGTDIAGSAKWQLLFVPGEMSKTFSIGTVLDAVPRTEGNEIFTVSARTIAGRSSVARQITIQDRIGEVLQSNDVVVTEGDSGTTTTASFIIEISEPAPYEVIVEYATRDGSARQADGDYEGVEGSLVFAAGETSKTIDVTIYGDDAPESNEFFFFDLFTPSLGVKVITPRLTGSIIDDDPVVARPPSASAFQIEVAYEDPSIDPAWQESVQNAVSKWQQVLVGDLPDVDVAGNGTDIIDDFRITVSVVPLSPFILGFARSTAYRDGVGGLPYAGEMTMNSLYADEDGFEGTILHELGHALGFTPNLWDDLGLLDDAVASDPRFTGSNATREYQQIFAVNETSVPLYEVGQPNDGSYGAHWRDSFFGDEIMVSAADPNVLPGPLSSITIGAFEDLGYQVDYSMADPFAPPLSRTADENNGDYSNSEATIPRRSFSPRQLPARVKYLDGSHRVLTGHTVTLHSPEEDLSRIAGPQLSPATKSASGYEPVPPEVFTAFASDLLENKDGHKIQPTSVIFASLSSDDVSRNN